MTKTTSAVDLFKEIALDVRLTREERLEAQAHLFTVAHDMDSIVTAFAELAHKAPSPSERMNAQDYLYKIITA